MTEIHYDGELAEALWLWDDFQDDSLIRSNPNIEFVKCMHLL